MVSRYFWDKDQFYPYLYTSNPNFISKKWPDVIYKSHEELDDDGWYYHVLIADELILVHFKTSKK